MKTQNSFGLIGLTRDELRIVQMLLNVTRKFTAEADTLVSWLNNVEEGKLMPGSTPLQAVNDDSNLPKTCWSP